MPRLREMSEATTAKTRLRKFRREVNKDVDARHRRQVYAVCARSRQVYAVCARSRQVYAVCARQTARAGHDGVGYRPLGIVSDAVLCAFLAPPRKQTTREIPRAPPLPRP